MLVSGVVAPARLRPGERDFGIVRSTVGDSDALVPPGQGFELYRALALLGVPAELLVFPGEGHRFHRPSHKVLKVQSELDRFERFLMDSSPGATGARRE